MSPRGTRHGPLSLLVSAVALAALALPAATQAAEPAAATISSCGADSLTVAGKVKLSGADARRARGAVLQMRFQAMPLFGLPRAAAWRSVGKKRSASGQEVFSGLPADNWVGVLTWRYKKGRRTVLSGDERSQALRIGGARGVANCAIAEGAKPVDSTPPTLYILPADGNWHHAPATVQLLAQDDFSGVKSVQYSIDGGPLTPIGNGGTFTIAGEGAHRIDWRATDVAGNTATRSDVVKVDAAPPTKPVLTLPAYPTAHPNPTFRLSPSSDSGSGLRGYLLTIRRADGSTAAVQPVDPGATSVTSSTSLGEGDYSAVLTAVDNTADQAWTTSSDAFSFRVDATPSVTKAVPAAGSVISANTHVFTLTLDRPADPTSVSGNVVLQNTTGAQPSSVGVGCANTPCTTISVTTDSSQKTPEGRYTLTLTSGVKSDEGTPFDTFTAKYGVAFAEGSNTFSSSICPPLTPPVVASGTITANAGDTVIVSYDYSFSGPGTGNVKVADNLGAKPYQKSASYSGGASGHDSLSLTLDANGSHTITVTQEFASCSSATSFTVSALASRAP